LGVLRKLIFFDGSFCFALQQRKKFCQQSTNNEGYKMVS